MFEDSFWFVAAPPPCLSQACLKATERLSASADPFAQFCNHFLFNCGPKEGVLSSGGTEKRRGEAEGHGGRMLGEKWSNRGRNAGRARETESFAVTPSIQSAQRTAVLQLIREILGDFWNTSSKAMLWWLSIIYLIPYDRLSFSAIKGYAFTIETVPLWHSLTFLLHALRIHGQTRVRELSWAEGQEVLQHMLGYGEDRKGWTRTISEAHREGDWRGSVNFTNCYKQVFRQTGIGMFLSC